MKTYKKIVLYCFGVYMKMPYKGKEETEWEREREG